MLEEAADEFVAGDLAGPPTRGFALLVSDGHGVIVESGDAGVGDGDAKDIAGEVVEHRLLALAPWRDMDDPGLAPCGLGEDEVRPSAVEHGPELAADELGQGFGREQETLAGGTPGAAVGRHPAPGDEAMDMGVIVQLLGPGVEHGHHADGAADKAAIAGELDDGLGVALISTP